MIFSFFKAHLKEELMFSMLITSNVSLILRIVLLVLYLETPCPAQDQEGLLPFLLEGSQLRVCTGGGGGGGLWTSRDTEPPPPGTEVGWAGTVDGTVARGASVL